MRKQNERPQCGNEKQSCHGKRGAKRLLSLALSLCLALAMMPAMSITASAATGYDIWVGGVRVTDANKGNITGSGIASGTVSYNSSTKTLTLSGAAITGAFGISSSQNYYAGIIGNSQLDTIEVRGDCSITPSSNSDNSCGIFSEVPLTFSGDGTLLAKGADVTGGSASSYGIYSSRPVMVLGPAITATGGTTANRTSYGIYIVAEKLTVSGGAVTATGGNAKNNSFGICAGSLSIGGAATMVTATGGIAGSDGSGYSSYGISAGFADSSISGGTVTATSGNAGTESYGIYTGSYKLFITGGTVTAKTNATSASTWAAMDKVPDISSYSGAVTLTGAGESPAKVVDTYTNEKYAKFGIMTTYDITYNGNGGPGSMASEKAAAGVAFPLPESTFTPPTGMTFYKWAIGSTDGTQVAANGSHTFMGDTTVYTLWKLPAPSAPDMISSSDSGTSSTDNITKVKTPTFSGTAQPNSTITLKSGNTTIGTGTADGSGNWSITASSLADGTHTITAIASASGIPSDPSSVLSITIDTIAPSGYSVSIDQAAINNANKGAMSFTFSEAEVSAKYQYTVSSSGGGSNVNGSGTIVNAGDQITGINLSGLGDGTVTLSAILTDVAGNEGTPATATAIKNTVAPPAPTAVSFSFDGADAKKLMGATSLMEYSLNGGSSYTACTTDIDLTSVLTGITAENDIKVRVKSTETQVAGAVHTIDITQAATPNLTATQPSTIGGSGSIPMTDAHEYSTNSGAAWTSAGGATVLSHGTYWVRVKAAGTVLASGNQVIILTPFNATPEVTPSAGIDYIAEKLTGLEANKEYIAYTAYPSGGTDKTADGDGNIVIDNSWFGTTISLAKKGNNSTTTNSAVTSSALAARPAAPATDTFTVTQPTADSATATIAGITTLMEYSTDGGITWTIGTGSDLTGLAPGTVLIRVKATESAPSGLNQTIIITAYSAPPSPSGGKGSTTPAAPTYKADVKEGDGTKESLPVTLDKDSKIASVDTVSRKNLSGEAVVTLPAVPDAQTYAVGIPVPDISTKDVQGSLTVETEKGSLTLPSNMLTDVAGTSGTKAQLFIGEGDKGSLPDAVKAAIGERPLLSLTLSIDGKKTNWSNPKAPVTVTMPYTPTAVERQNPESIVVWYIDGNGKVVTVPNGRYDVATGTVAFEVTHFSNYAVAYNKVNFSDVADSSWYGKAVSFIAAREITGGTAEGIFSPGAKLTRGQFMVMLMKAYGIEPDSVKTGTEGSSANFADAGNTYYTGYLAAAKRLGITAGVGDNLYAPSKEINRQEMFTLLYNALKVIGQAPQGNSGKALSDFTDAEKISPWAKDAMASFITAGIASGSNGTLLPQGTTTRAEMAQVLYNLLGK